MGNKPVTLLQTVSTVEYVVLMYLKVLSHEFTNQKFKLFADLI